MVKYTFIHPTKSGGTSIEEYFSEHYSDYIIGGGHVNICNNNNNPIIVIRDVKSRFFSMYKYWKYGALDTKYKRTEKWKKHYANASILYFINIFKKNSANLYCEFLWGQHYYNSTKWIKENTDYKNIIIIKYESNLNEKIQQLINLLGIPNKNIPLPIKNISVNVDNEEELNNDYVNNFISEYFKDDIILINKIETNPELFKFVI
jgi:hypothetical protein